MAWTLEAERLRYCSVCGASVDQASAPGDRRVDCPECETRHYRNPVPMARATVVDGDRALLIERGRAPDRGTWALPGGHVEFDEPPAVAAARELAEETGIRVAPDDLSVLGTGFLEFEGGETMVSINYATALEHASGDLEAGSDASAARYWSRQELRNSPPLLRASGLEQVLEAIDRHGDAG